MQTRRPPIADPDDAFDAADPSLTPQHAFRFRAIRAAALPILIVGRGVVVWLAWHWFVVPRSGLPDLTFGPAVGLPILLLLLGAHPRDRVTSPGVAAAAAHAWSAVFGLGALIAALAVVQAISGLW